MLLGYMSDLQSCHFEMSYGELSDCSWIVVFGRQSVLWVMPHWMLLRSVVLPPSLGILVFLVVLSRKTLPKGNHQIWALKWWDWAVLQWCELDLPRRNPDAVSCAEHAVTVRCPILWWKWPAGVQYCNRKAEISNTRVLTLFKFQFLFVFWI